MRFSIGPNRYVCSVLDEMRALDKTKNYSCLLSLIEEVQTLVNRMEAGLADVKDLKYLKEQIQESKDELSELKKEIKANTDLKNLIK